MYFRIFFHFIFILIIIPLVFTANYYEILGVPKDADTATIKKAFKKLSLKYHPDKNRQNTEKTKEKFTEIINAYETLKDPKKRKKYDLQGEEEIKYSERKQNTANFKKNYDFEEFFSDYFSKFNFRGSKESKKEKKDYENHNSQEYDEAKNEDFFSLSLVFELDLGSLRYFFNRKEVWLILFYKSNQKTSQTLKPIWLDLSTKYNGIFRVAAVNCFKEKEICNSEFKVKTYPTIKGYHQAKASKGILYNDQSITIEGLAKFANSLMKDNVEKVSNINYESFFRIHPNKFKILVFSKKQNASILLKSLALSLADSMKFGLVNEADKILIDKYKVVVFPSLYLIKNPLDFEGIRYEGNFKKEKIMIFLRENTKGTPIQIKPFAGTVLHLNKKTLEKGICGLNNPYYCFVMITTKMNENQLNILRQLAQIYKKDPIHFLFLKSNDINYDIVFPEIESLPKFIIIKGKNNKYIIMDDFSFDIEKVKDFIDNTLSGSGSKKFILINGSLQNAFKYKVKTEL